MVLFVFDSSFCSFSSIILDMTVCHVTWTPHNHWHLTFYLFFLSFGWFSFKPMPMWLTRDINYVVIGLFQEGLTPSTLHLECGVRNHYCGGVWGMQELIMSVSFSLIWRHSNRRSLLQAACFSRNGEQGAQAPPEKHCAKNLSSEGMVKIFWFLLSSVDILLILNGSWKWFQRRSRAGNTHFTAAVFCVSLTRQASGQARFPQTETPKSRL